MVHTAWCQIPELQHSYAGLEQPASCCSWCLQCAMVSSRSFGLQMLQSPELILSLLLTCGRVIFMDYSLCTSHKLVHAGNIFGRVLGAHANPCTVH